MLGSWLWMYEYGTEEWYLVEENLSIREGGGGEEKTCPSLPSATLSAHIDRHGIDPEPRQRVA